MPTSRLFNERPVCPTSGCGSTQTRYRSRTNDWKCTACGNIFTVDKPQDKAPVEEKKG